MSKFRFYITDTLDGSVVGTDDEQQALAYAGNEDNFVVDTETGEWIMADGVKWSVPEVRTIELSDDHTEDEKEEENDEE